MGKKSISPNARRQVIEISTKASAGLEQRAVPADHVRSAKAEMFVKSLRVKV